jgi:hypothetical protein
VADLTVYVPDDLASRARAASVPLSRAMRAVLLGVLAVVDGDEPEPSAGPVHDVLELMRGVG